MNNKILIERVSLKSKIARSLWNLVYLLLFRPFGTKLFNPWRIALLKLFGAKVKWDSGVYCSCRIWAPWNLQMGHNAWLGPHTICYNQAMVMLDDDVTVSQYAYICAAGHMIDSVNRNGSGLVVAPVHLRKGAWVGTRAYIGMGVEIGEYAIVGATASVYKDVEDYAVVGGNPAVVIKKRIIETQSE